MRTRFIHHILPFSSCILLIIASNYPAQAAPSKAEIDNYARANGFPRSDYPYYEPVNQCGGEGATSAVPDKYEVAVNIRDPLPPWRKKRVVTFHADFNNACDNHDRCYMTAGKPREDCDNRFRVDLLRACREPVTVLEPSNLATCISLAETYANAVYAAGTAFYPNAQAQAKRYETLVENFIALSASSSQLASADLCWYQHSGWQDGSASWASGNCTKVGNGWSFKTVFASSDGVVYGINANNELLWYKHNGWQNGSSSWASGTGTKVGSGWSFKTVFASSNGIVYGINANNELLWYKHNGWQNGSSSWASGTGTKVGSGWSFKTVFASSDGVIYRINVNNELCWYKHNGWQNGSSSWASNNCTKVGTGWDFTTVFASSNGVIYGVKPNGDLYWYRHDGWQDGSNRWANGGTGIKVGSGWNFQSVFATSDGSIYGIVR